MKTWSSLGGTFWHKISSNIFLVDLDTPHWKYSSKLTHLNQSNQNVRFCETLLIKRVLIILPLSFYIFLQNSKTNQYSWIIENDPKATTRLFNSTFYNNNWPLWHVCVFPRNNHTVPLEKHEIRNFPQH